MLNNPVGIALIYSILRKTAKTNKWQTLYAQSKEGCVNLFKNVSAYTDLQVAFLQYCTFYNSLNIDIYMDEVSDIVLDNEIYEDAYQTYKNKVKKNKSKKITTPQEQDRRKKSKNKDTNISNTHVVFSRPPIRK